MFAVLDRGESPLPAQRIGSFDVAGAGVERDVHRASLQEWGRWSNGPKVTLTLAKPIKGRLELIVVILAFGRNVGKQSPVNIGVCTEKLRIPYTHVILQCDNAK
ncbi:MAG: hypothetical protein JO076_10330 [Verrucomicrobia bacterium]|nr:hypothetical protein [Verrucomicrobiota bacterium]